MTVLGVDANVENLVVAAVPAHPTSLPRQFDPPGFDAPGLCDFQDLLVDHLTAHGISSVVLVSDLSARVSPTNVRSRTQLETVLAVAAHRAGCSVTDATLGTALGHLGLDRRAGGKRGRLRIELRARLGPDRLSPRPERRAAALGVALALADLKPEDIA